MSEPVWEQLTLSQEDSPASHTVLREKERERRMKGIFGPSSSASLKSFNQEPFWVKTCLAYYLPYMRTFAPIWKKQVTRSGRSVYRLTLSVRTMRDTGWQLFASPRASQDFKPIRKQTPQEHCGKHGNALCGSIGIVAPELIGQHINPQFSAWLMGFPEDWLDGVTTRQR